ncbi:hypothetical protein Ahu01nite_072580 [Winogradskya humida]|uniref:Uncharacterized protein n=1 Tax=Winogradskya humida TaxID=113566 RepID=A0ABQ3ZZX3_9ACTN|nr:hypothetical protein Ahu01nite_072580 [Actinoplanes humidus]
MSVAPSGSPVTPGSAGGADRLDDRRHDFFGRGEHRIMRTLNTIRPSYARTRNVYGQEPAK